MEQYVLLLRDTIASKERQVVSDRPQFFIKHMKPDSMYEYRVRAINSVNISGEVKGGKFCKFYSSVQHFIHECSLHFQTLQMFKQPEP